MCGCKSREHVQNFDKHVQRERLHLQPHNLDIIVRGFCRDIQVNITIDTGGNASLISTKLVDQLNIIDEIKPTTIKIAGLANKILPMRGELKLPLKVGNDEIEHNFIVCDFLTEDILAGNDILIKLGAKIDIAKRKLKTKGGSIKFFEKPGYLNKICKIKASETVTIKGKIRE